MKAILENIDKTLVGGITVLFLAIISIIMYIFDKDYMVPIWMICIIIMISYLVCIIIYAILKNNKQIQGLNEGFKIDGFLEQNLNYILLLKESKILKINNIVSIYVVNKNKIEEFVGLGLVTNIQEDKRIQVKLMLETTNYDIDKIKKMYKDIKIKTILNLDNIADLINS